MYYIIKYISQEFRNIDNPKEIKRRLIMNGCFNFITISYTEYLKKKWIIFTLRLNCINMNYLLRYISEDARYILSDNISLYINTKEYIYYVKVGSYDNRYTYIYPFQKKRRYMDDNRYGRCLFEIGLPQIYNKGIYCCYILIAVNI